MAHIVRVSSNMQMADSVKSFSGRNKISPVDIHRSAEMSEIIHNSNQIHEKLSDNDEILKLNVGGKMFNVKRNTLEKRRQGILSSLCQDRVRETSGIFFFDRNPRYFCAILDFYRTGNVHVAQDFCGEQFEEELEFWGLTDDVIGDCCWRRYSDLREEQSQNRKVRREFLDVCEIKLSRMKGLPHWKERLWVTLEDPSYSNTAKAVLFIYLLLVMLSLFNACAISYITYTTLHIYQSGGIVNATAEKRLVSEVKSSTGIKALHFVEVCCLIFLFAFFVVRICVCPMKCRFLKSVLNILDLVYLLISGFNTIMMLYFDISGVADLNWKSFERVVQICYHLSMIVGMLRVFRAARHYRGVRELWYAIRASFREVWLLSIFVTIGIVIFGVAFYCAQLTSESYSHNIFTAFWWALITMTTVGYGDVVPTVVLGYLVAAVCALVGLVMISLPIPVIAHNFRLYYSYKSRTCRKLEKSTSIDIYK